MDLQKLVNYDKWANKKILQVIHDIEEPSLLEEIETLFAHLLTAQVVWMNRIEDQSLPDQIWPQLTFSEMRSLVEDNPAKLQKLISRKSKAIAYKNSKGTVFNNTVEEILVHLTIHGQHHRAQIANLLRQNGIEPPATDFIFFLRTLDN
jgi:uncharacterized damage-inducible protein DinB